MAAVLESRVVVLLLAASIAVGSAYLTGVALGHQGQSRKAIGKAISGAVPGTPLSVSSSCHLANGIQHIVYVQLENLKLTRDVPSVPSDLEQMPHLLGFLEANGALLPTQRGALRSEPAQDSLTALTGLYPDRYGPAPWPAFTRAGCDVGSVGGPGDLVLRDTGGDLDAAFGTGSREVSEARTYPARAAADFTGVAVHCAVQSRTCAGGRARPDRLPEEPGGYAGFGALFGQRDVGAGLGLTGGLEDLTGKPIAGFPGFDALTPAVSLAYVAAMQEHGVPVTYADIADPHGFGARGSPLAPGEPAYERQLRDYDLAFASFQRRLNRDGLTPANTLFVVSGSGGGGFVAASPPPARCAGVQLACQYPERGAVQVDLAGLLAGQSVPAPLETPFTTESGSSPAVWISGDPDAAAPQTRRLEQALAGLRVQEPATGAAQPLLGYLADRAEMRLLHMFPAAGPRRPSFVLFPRPGYLVDGTPAGCPPGGCAAAGPGQPYPAEALEPGAGAGWLALAGPGVEHRRLDGAVWADQADVRPTVLALTGLRDAYGHDGRVLSEALQAQALPPGIAASQASYEALGGRLKQLDAPAGRVGMLSLAVATRAAASASAGDADYRSYAARMDGYTRRRDAVVEAVRAALEQAAFGGMPLDARTAAPLAGSADELIAEMARA